MAVEQARDHRDFRGEARGVGERSPRDLLAPQHREVRRDELVLAGQVEPDLKQLGGVRLVLLEQGEHLAVNDAATRGEPLRVSAAEASGGAE